MKIKIILTLLTIIAALTIYSCKKEFFESDEVPHAEKISIQEARAYFKKSILTTKSVETSLQQGKNPIRPYWHKALVGSTSDKSFVEVPLQSPGLIFSLYSFDDDGAPTTLDKSLIKYAFKRLIMYKDYSGKITSRILTYVPEKSFLEKNKMDGSIARVRNLKNYSGYIQVHSLDNEPISIYKYFEGKLTVRVKLFKNVNQNTSTSGIKIKGSYTVCIPQYTTICAGPGEDSPSGEEQCTRTYTGDSCNDYWIPDPVDPNHPNEPGEDQPPTPTIPGDPTFEPPIREIKLDSLTRKFPCVTKTVINALKGNQKFYDLLKPFDDIILPNGQKITAPNTPKLQFDAAPQPWGANSIYSLGTTQTIPGDALSSIITFNSSAITGASRLMIQTAAIHEAGHAYANYYVKVGSWGFPVDTTRYKNWALDIANFESASRDQKNNPNFYDHSTFLENYFDDMVAILREINGTAFTDKQYRMAVLYGMDNAGERPANDYMIAGIAHYDILRTAQLKSYNNIKDKYGITTSELSTFYQANIINVSANRKVPTTCP